MNRLLRQRIALFLSLIMVTFTACQGMALAAVPDSMRSDSASMASMSCHEASPQDTGAALTDCPSDCNAVVKASDSGPLFQSLLPLVFIAFQLPDLAQEAGPIHVALLGLHDPVTDPPPDIRYHRFRE
ncbi:MAG: hypothetical protein WBJ03_14165 [Moraxellaceae bacterium]